MTSTIQQLYLLAVWTLFMSKLSLQLFHLIFHLSLQILSLCGQLRVLVVLAQIYGQLFTLQQQSLPNDGHFYLLNPMEINRSTS